MIKNYLGIDPDTDKSGLAYYNTDTKEFKMELFTFYDLLETVKNYCKSKNNYLILLEAGWLNKTKNYHNFNSTLNARNEIERLEKSKAISALIGSRVGANHQTGLLMERFFIDNKLNYELIRPYKSKINAKQFKDVTGCSLRTNQETRDAAMLIVRYLNLDADYGLNKKGRNAKEILFGGGR